MSDVKSPRAWPDHGLPDTHLGLSKNGKKW
jgi:hypothetical protein